MCTYIYILHAHVSLITWQHGSRNFPATLVRSVQVIEGRTETLKDQLFNKAESNNVPWAQTSRVTSGRLQRGHLDTFGRDSTKMGYLGMCDRDI